MLKSKLYDASYIALALPFTYTSTFYALLTEEYPQRDVISSELELAYSAFLYRC